MGLRINASNPNPVRLGRCRRHVFTQVDPGTLCALVLKTTWSRDHQEATKILMVGFPSAVPTRRTGTAGLPSIPLRLYAAPGFRKEDVYA